MLYADDAGVVSRSAEGLARMMTAVVEPFANLGLAVSEKKTETLLMHPPERPAKGGLSPPPLVVLGGGAAAHPADRVLVPRRHGQRRRRPHARDQP